MPTREGPEGDEAQVNVSGLPVRYKDQMRAVADTLPGSKRGRLKRAYTEAISEYLDEVEGLDDVQLLGSTKGGARQIVWIPLPLFDRLNAFCNGKVFINSLLITAVDRYLKSKGEL